jgi:S1-C subfamily serine protease
LAESEPHTPGALGFSVQPTSLGVAVSWVDPEGPASRELSATDLIQSVNGRPVNTSDEWRAQLRSVSSGDEVKLRVRSEGEVREVTVVAAPVADRPDDPALGLHLRTLPRRGAEVLAVDPRSRGEHAGIRAGDVITVIGWQKTPTAHQVTRTFDTAQSGEKLLVALNRQDEHLVVVLEKQARATSTK